MRGEGQKRIDIFGLRNKGELINSVSMVLERKEGSGSSYFLADFNVLDSESLN